MKTQSNNPCFFCKQIVGKMNTLNLPSETEGGIINRVTNSGIVTFNLEDYYTKGTRMVLDIAPALHEGLILREKDYRQWLKDLDLTPFQDALVAITCTADAIIPTWAFMLAAGTLEPVAKFVCFGTLADLENTLFLKELNALNWESYAGKRVVVKGCSDIAVPILAYVEATQKLKPITQSLMFGEPCSTVPLFKAKKV